MDGNSNNRTTKTDGGTVYKQILMNAKLPIGKRSKDRADWEKPIKEREVRIGL